MRVVPVDRFLRARSCAPEVRTLPRRNDLTVASNVGEADANRALDAADGASARVVMHLHRTTAGSALIGMASVDSQQISAISSSSPGHGRRRGDAIQAAWSKTVLQHVHVFAGAGIVGAVATSMTAANSPLTNAPSRDERSRPQRWALAVVEADAPLLPREECRLRDT